MQRKRSAEKKPKEKHLPLLQQTTHASIRESVKEVTTVMQRHINRALTEQLTDHSKIRLGSQICNELLFGRCKHPQVLRVNMQSTAASSYCHMPNRAAAAKALRGQVHCDPHLTLSQSSHDPQMQPAYDPHKTLI